MNIARPIFFMLFCFCSNFMVARGFSTRADTTKMSAKNLWICNSMGLGYAEKGMIYGDQLYFGYKNFALGARARSGFKKYVGIESINPYTSYDDYKFVKEYALLIGYRKWNWESTGLIIAAGPLMRYDKIKYWPAKGSGGVPFWGALLTKKESVMNYGVTVSVEAYYVNKNNWNGFSCFLFTSITKDHFVVGASLNWVIGTLKSNQTSLR